MEDLQCLQILISIASWNVDSLMMYFPFWICKEYLQDKKWQLEDLISSCGTIFLLSKIQLLKLDAFLEPKTKELKLWSILGMSSWKEKHSKRNRKLYNLSVNSKKREKNRNNKWLINQRKRINYFQASITRKQEI